MKFLSIFTILIFAKFALSLKLDSNHENNEFINQLSLFVSNVIKLYFSECDAIFVHDAKFQFENLTEIYESIFLENGIENSLYFGNIWHWQNPEEVYESFDDVHRLNSKHCAVVLIYLNRVTLEKNYTSDQIFELITKKYGAISRKDEDYYIYISGKGEELAKTMLLMDLATKTKYKLAIYKDSPLISGLTVCFYCINGQPVNVEINLSGHLKSFLDLDPEAISLAKIFPDFVVNFHGRILRVSSPTRLTLGMEIHHKNGQWQSKRGIYVSVLHTMMKIYNFTYIIFPASGGGGTGFELPNGTWIGSTSDILYNRADIGMTTCQVLARSKKYGFSARISFLVLTFTVGIPRPIYQWNSMLWPLNNEVWYLIIVSFFVMIASLKFVSDYGGYNPIETPNSEMDQNITYVIGTLLEQCLRRSYSSPERMIWAFWLCYSLVIGTGYRSKLVSFLAFPNVKKPPTTFNELVDEKGWSWGLEAAGIQGAIYDDLESSDNPTYQKIFRKMTLEPDPVKCFLKGINADFACLVYVVQQKYIFYKNFSSRARYTPWIVAPDTTFLCTTGFVMEIRAIFRTNFDKVIWASMDSGLINKWLELDYEDVRSERLGWEKEVGKKSLIPDKPDSGPSKLHMENFKGSYYLFVLGMILGFILYFVEYIYEDVKAILRRRKHNLTKFARSSYRASKNKITTLKTIITKESSL